MKIVIIGGGAAGPKVAAKSKRMNKDNEIVIYTKSNVVSYSACGLPYYISGIVKDIKNLIIRTPSEFKAQGIDVHLNSPCTKILPKEKSVIIGDEKVSYDELVIATGAIPKPINIRNMDLKNVFRLNSIEDGIKIREKMLHSKRAIIIGGGYIAIELLEAFVKNHVHTTIVELNNQILPLFDEDMAQTAEDYIKSHSFGAVDFILGDRAIEFLGEEKFEGVKTLSGKEIYADFCVVAIGVVPNTSLAKDCGIKIGKTGGIVVDNKMRTNIEHIWAAGDCTEEKCLITKEPIYISLGSIANKEGRVCAMNLNGEEENFDGILFSAVARYFDFTMSATGLNERIAKKYAKYLDVNPVSSMIVKSDRAGYMPEANDITLKLVGDTNGDILGIQATGKGDADKRVNVVAGAITRGLKIDDLLHIDLTYAPPYGVAIDPLHEVAYALKKKIKK